MTGCAGRDVELASHREGSSRYWWRCTRCGWVGWSTTKSTAPDIGPHGFGIATKYDELAVANDDRSNRSR